MWVLWNFYMMLTVCCHFLYVLIWLLLWVKNHLWPSLASSMFHLHKLYNNLPSYSASVTSFILASHSLSLCLSLEPHVALLWAALACLITMVHLHSTLFCWPASVLGTPPHTLIFCFNSTGILISSWLHIFYHLLHPAWLIIGTQQKSVLKLKQ